MVMFLVGTINFMSILVANLVALFTLITAGLGSSYKVKDKSKESKTLIIMMILIAIASICDPIVFLVDGNTGIVQQTNEFYRFINHFLNGVIYLIDLMVIISWGIFLIYHLNGEVGKQRFIIYGIVVFVAFILLIINVFVPFMYEVDENCVYKRIAEGSYGYILFMTIELSIALESVLAFIRIRRKGGMLKFFPIWVFLVPGSLGVAAQAIYYGISTINVGFALAVCAMLMSMQNDLIFCDKLTGLYNRYYLDRLKKKMMKSKKNAEYTAMMLDLNGFKSINDTYGHLEGDNALIKTGELLRKAVGSYGTVIRYAGDEFVIILNTQVDSIIREVLYSIQRQFDSYNKAYYVPYILSISIGYSKADLKKYTIDELMNEIDQKMYIDKENHKKKLKDETSA